MLWLGLPDSGRAVYRENLTAPNKYTNKGQKYRTPNFLQKIFLAKIRHMCYNIEEIVMEVRV